MWKNWKKKVNDFFYHDLEIEDEDEMDNSEVTNETVPSKLQNNRTINTKMKYEYPKDQITPFRFPVIPDVQKHKNTKQVIQKQNIAKKRKTVRGPRVKRDVLKDSYTVKKTEKELEDIPAYIRRRKAEKIAEQKHEIEIKKEKEKQIEQIKVPHTKPEELDRIFKIRDGILKEEIRAGEAKQMSRDSDTLENVVHEESIQSAVDESKELQPLVHIENKNDEFIVEAFEPERQTDFELTYHQQAVSIEQQHVKEEEVVHSEIMEEWKDVPNHLLNDPIEPDEDDSVWLSEQQSLLEQTLTHFNVKAKVVNVTQGPSVTRFEIQPALGVKVSRVRNLADDIKLNLAAKDIRIEAPIPGKNTIGIEVPNQYPQAVNLQEMIETEDFLEAESPLTIALGLTIEGEPLITDIGKMPHGLIAGATGSGKSVCINTILLSLLYKSNHHEVKFLLIDPKMVELTPYNGIPHLIAPVITDAKAATMSLKWAVDEMEDRYEKFVAAGVRNISKYNEKMVKQNQQEDKLPYIVIVIDELADLMMVSPQEVEDAICRIAQKARACGMHLLLATQRPSVDVITGLIKANIPTRIAFSVSSQVDSRTMIDTAGAEKLLGKGDMLFVENGANKSVRLQGPFVSDEEIDRVANYMRTVAEPNYLFEQEQLLLDVQAEDEDELLPDVISFVVNNNQASTSLLQRRFRIGYNRAARLIDTLESKGIVSAQNGSKPREVLITKNQIEELI